MINTKQKGMSLVEILIAVLIFSFGIATISAALTYGLQTILVSKDAVVSNQQIINAGETYMLKRIMDKTKMNDLSLSDLGLPEKGKKEKFGGTRNIPLGSSSNNISFNIYRLKTDDKSNPIYVLERQ